MLEKTILRNGVLDMIAWVTRVTCKSGYTSVAQEWHTSLVGVSGVLRDALKALKKCNKIPPKLQPLPLLVSVHFSKPSSRNNFYERKSLIVKKCL